MYKTSITVGQVKPDIVNGFRELCKDGRLTQGELFEKGYLLAKESIEKQKAEKSQ